MLSGWGPDYNDVLTYGDLFSSWNLQNRGRYSSQDMDALIRIAQSELDPQKRMDAFGEIQHLLYEDVVILPMYERGFSFVVDPRLKDFRRRSWVRKLIITMRISNSVLTKPFNPDSRSR